jgi:hypothetical protein
MHTSRISRKIAACLAMVAAVVGLGMLLAQTSNAQTTGQALEISPPLLALTADPGETIKSQVRVRNVSRTDLVVTGEANDFVAAGEDGTPKVLLEEDEVGPYSIKEWIVIPNKVTIAPQEIKTMNITIRVPDDASPGGHYGVVRFTGTPPNLEGQGVALTASLGSLILLSVNGDTTESLSVDEFNVSKNGKTGTFFESTPLTFIQRIKNSGNVHERPGGAVTIKNMFNKTVATFPYNPGARYILPGSVRKFEQQSSDPAVLGDKRLFGKYTATITLTYSANNDKTATSTVTFWVMPWKLVLVVIGGLVAGFFILRFAIKRYNRAVIKRANRR